jgi:CRP-like cAMP-binding protein
MTIMINQALDSYTDFQRRSGVAPSAYQNRILDALSSVERARLDEHLSAVDLAYGDVLCEAGCHASHAYFPLTAEISLCSQTGEGGSAELVSIGNEGLAGVCMILGAEPAPHRLVVQSAGKALRIGARALKEEFHRGELMQHLLLCYTHVLISHSAQNAICNRHHLLEQRLCRRLLSSMDRGGSNLIFATQDNLAQRLGVRREGITVAAGRMQKAGVIEYHRGHITVIDRTGLEARSCECYGIIRQQLERLRSAA